MAENNNIFFVGGDALVYLTVPMYKKYFTTFVSGHTFSTYVSQDRFFNTPLPCKHMYAFRVTVSAVGLFQKPLLNTITHMTQMLQVNKNSNINYNVIQVKLN